MWLTGSYIREGNPGMKYSNQNFMRNIDIYQTLHYKDWLFNVFLILCEEYKFLKYSIRGLHILSLEYEHPDFRILSTDSGLLDEHLKRLQLCRWCTLQLFHGYVGTVKLLSRGSGEDMGNCCQKRGPRTTVSQIFSTTDGQWFDCFPSGHEITVYYPIVSN